MTQKRQSLGPRTSSTRAVRRSIRRTGVRQWSEMRQLPARLRRSLVDGAMRARTSVMIAAIAMIAVACSGGADSAGDGGPSAGPVVASRATGFERTLPAGPSALDDMAHPALPVPLVEPSEIIPGGPPPDGIPSIDIPEFIPIAAADTWLADEEPVVYLEINGDVHAYPVQVLLWHEIVNDTVGGVPVAVTYCPLCNSAVSYERAVDGIETTFGTSGSLYASALVMYDRATESLWTHFDGRAVAGVLTGRKLEPISSPLLAWSTFKEAFPTGLVLDKAATGFAFPYGENPYVGYDNPESIPFLFRGTVDTRARAKERVIGVALGDAASAWTLDTISGGHATATNTTVGEEPVVILWQEGQVTALETQRLISGRDVGSVGVFRSIVDGSLLVFEAIGDRFVDTETGTEWDITGAAIAGPLAGERLERIHHLDTFWFAWSTYRPGTDLVAEPSPVPSPPSPSAPEDGLPDGPPVRPQHFGRPPPQWVSSY